MPAILLPRVSDSIFTLAALLVKKNCCSSITSVFIRCAWYLIAPCRQAQRPAEVAEYNQLRMHVCTCMCTLHCGENAAGKCTRKEISLFCAESVKVVSSSDYHT